MDIALINIPPLIQLCAEKLAKIVKKDQDVDQYLAILNEILIPNIYINYIEDNKYYRRCEFMKYLKTKKLSQKLIPTLPKGCLNKQFKITVGNEKAIYVSPVFELGRNMLKFDFPEGEYELCPFDEGYILKTKEYLKPKMEDAIHALSSIGSDGTTIINKWNKPSEEDNIHHLRIFNEFISEYISQKWWEYATPIPCRLVVKSFKDFNDIPVLFYLIQHINIHDLDKITLSCPSVINNCSNVQVCWDVLHTEKGRLGIGIKQKEFLNLMVDPPNVCTFVHNEFRALGNLDHVRAYNRYGKNTKFYMCHGIYMRVPGKSRVRERNSEQVTKLTTRP